MKWLGLLALIFYSAFTVQASESKPFLALGCQLRDSEGRIVRDDKAPICVFFQNGFQSVYDGKFLKTYSPQKKLIWKKKLQLRNLFADPLGPIILTRRLEKVLSCQVPFDKMTLLDLKTGREIRSLDLKKLGEQIVQNSRWGMNVLTPPRYERIHERDEYFCDFTGIGSINLIKPNLRSQEDPAFQVGNYIMTLDRFSSVVILDPQWKKVLYQADFSTPARWYQTKKAFLGIADAQVDSVGDFIYYFRVRKPGQPAYMVARKWDPQTGAVVWSRKIPYETYSDNGFIQELENGNYLLSFQDDKGNGRTLRIQQDGKLTEEPAIYPVTDLFRARQVDFEPKVRDLLEGGR